MIWMITLKKKYVDAFLEGKKKIEIRTRIPKDISAGDTILCAMSNSNGQVVFLFDVSKAYKGSPEFLWRLYRNCLGIELGEYIEYTKGRKNIWGLYVEKIKKLPQGTTVADFGLSRSPQWFTKIQNDYKNILKHNAL